MTAPQTVAWFIIVAFPVAISAVIWDWAAVATLRVFGFCSRPHIWVCERARRSK